MILWISKFIILVSVLSIILGTAATFISSYTIHLRTNLDIEKRSHAFRVIVYYFNTIYESVYYPNGNIKNTIKVYESSIDSIIIKFNNYDPIVYLTMYTIKIGDTRVKFTVIDYLKYCIWLKVMYKKIFYGKNNFIIKHIIKWNDAIIDSVDHELDILEKQYQ